MRILLTGGTGFLGGYVNSLLMQRGYSPMVFGSDEYDLRDQNTCHYLLAKTYPDVVIHMAATVGGIGFNRENPGTCFYDNIIMGVNLMESARLHDVSKFVNIGTICSYPKHTPVPFKESDLWNGYPEETNAPYGIAKKALIAQAQAYRQQYNFNAISLLPVNLYGPGDNFKPNSSHVIPALIKKVLEAKKSGTSVSVWGTGKATREFLYVEDAAEAIVDATFKYNKVEPMNIGSGEEISIADLVKLICIVCDYEGEIIWDTSKPDGQPRRCLDISKSIDEIGWYASTSLITGLSKTVEWYEQEEAYANG